MTWKCVLCGAISSCPTHKGVGDAYEKLTEEDKALCPPR